MSGLVKWVAQLSCGHTTGGECAEEHLPTVNDEMSRVVCGTCPPLEVATGPRTAVILDLVDSRPLRVT